MLITIVIGAPIIIVGSIFLIYAIFMVTKPYSIDSEHVYDSKKRIVPDADPATFKLIDSQVTENGSYSLYFKDKNHVFYQEHDTQDYLITPIPAADPYTFDVVKRNGEVEFAKDKNHVYEAGIAIPSADPKTYMTYGPTTAFSKDANHVYCRSGKSTTVPGTDSANFNIVQYEDRFSKRPVYSSYATTDNHVIFAGDACAILEGADPKKFKLLAGYLTEIASDSSHIYIKGKSVPIDISTFELLVDERNGWATGFKDKNHTYTFEGQSDSYKLVR